MCTKQVGESQLDGSMNDECSSETSGNKVGADGKPQEPVGVPE